MTEERKHWYVYLRKRVEGEARDAVTNIEKVKP